jgi:deoxycytidine triphosphate deaminase
MFIHPLSLNMITNIDSKCNQPNAVDIRVSELRTIEALDHTDSVYDEQCFTISDSSTEHKQKSMPLMPDADGYWHLLRGIYEVTSPHFVTVPEGYAGYLITRSSFNRNGIFILSGLYDAGFTGYVQGTLYNLAGRIKMQYLTRVCQFVLLKAETAHLYKGQYSHDKNPSDSYPSGSGSS